MTWREGTPLRRFLETDPPLELRNAFALTMFRAWYVPFYFYGVIHGDPHLGNYTVRDDGAVNLLDFGCIRIFPASFIQGVIDLYRALRDDDEALAVHARSEERRVGKECGSTCRSRWVPYPLKK